MCGPTWRMPALTAGLAVVADGIGVAAMHRAGHHQPDDTGPPPAARWRGVCTPAMPHSAKSTIPHLRCEVGCSPLYMKDPGPRRYPTQASPPALTMKASTPVFPDDHSVDQAPQQPVSTAKRRPRERDRPVAHLGHEGRNSSSRASRMPPQRVGGAHRQVDVAVDHQRPSCRLRDDADGCGLLSRSSRLSRSTKVLSEPEMKRPATSKNTS